MFDTLPIRAGHPSKIGRDHIAASKSQDDDRRMLEGWQAHRAGMPYDYEQSDAWREGWRMHAAHARNVLTVIGE
jgi:hypothetical protein